MNSIEIKYNEEFDNKIDEKQKETNEEFDTLVLSGGGTKGYILLGALQAAIDSNKLNNIKNYLGTSIGSAICYLLTIGYTPIEIIVQLNIVFKNNFEKMKDLDLNKMLQGDGALNFNHLMEIMEKLTLNKIGKFLTLGKLKEIYGKTLICVTHNTTECRTEYLGPDNHPDLPCITAIRMSANLPLIFEKFKYMNCYYIDGGMTDNFPIKKAFEYGKNILGISLDINTESLRSNPDDGIMTYFLKLLQTPILELTRRQIELYQDKCKIIFIKNKLVNSFTEFDISYKEKLDMFSIGYEQTKLELNS